MGGSISFPVTMQRRGVRGKFWGEIFEIQKYWKSPWPWGVRAPRSKGENCQNLLKCLRTTNLLKNYVQYHKWLPDLVKLNFTLIFSKMWILCKKAEKWLPAVKGLSCLTTFLTSHISKCEHCIVIHDCEWSGWSYFRVFFHSEGTPSPPFFKTIVIFFIKVDWKLK